MSYNGYDMGDGKVELEGLDHYDLVVIVIMIFFSTIIMLLCSIKFPEMPWWLYSILIGWRGQG